ncbi:hypothetical protein BW730_12565 [Tessaracoccus aquimaris]|uniref:Haloacid dehalogenase n=1 Tax=Tessaracoccus aquimaris TaxID=1332264 RepID=A0A1Q2CTA9_9ACTN|nr:hypothetical protein BW730_12565 [Tessaracoccus aquimaris]
MFVYDLDGVITTRDTLTALIVERLRSRPGRALRAIPHAATRLFCRGAARHDRARAVVGHALAGLGLDEYERLAATVGARLGSDSRWIRRAVCERLRSRHAAGARIVIATASEELLVRALLEGAGVPFDLLSATTLGTGRSGLRVDDYRIGPRKATALLQAGVRIDEATFVTDSTTDLPTARLAASVELVGASRRTSAAFRRAGVAADEGQGTSRR